MTEKTYKIGDVVAWAKVPNGALVLFGIEYARRLGVDGWWCIENAEWYALRDDPSVFIWDNERPHGALVTIIALGLTGREIAADLQRMAEVFEVQEALRGLFGATMKDRALRPTMLTLVAFADARSEGEPKKGIDVLAEHLHASGWRPGDTAERASELLRGAP
jgi:hypothetical protein